MTRDKLAVAGFAVLVFVAALGPRLYALGSFLTIDEVKWAEGAAQFLLALHSGNLAQTYWHFHPGITITWGSALTLGVMCLAAPDLAKCAQTQVEHLPVAIGWLRLTPVLLTSFGISGVYLLGRKLFSHKTALLAALLLAFDPFFMAHSRILNGDAGAAILMFLALLAFLVYWLKDSPGEPISKAANQELVKKRNPVYHSLLLSGVLAGLALLTKLPAPLIGLFIGGLGLAALVRDWPQAGWSAVRSWLGALVLWGAIALLVFVLLWPALWLAPAQTLRQMYLDSFEVGGVGEGHDAFFLGQILVDPGSWFYPYALAFRLTPVVALGLILLFIGLISRFRLQKLAIFHASPEHIAGWVILGFVVFLVVFANISPKKLDRYVMGVIPALIFLSAIGLTGLEQLFKFSSAPLRSVWLASLLLVGLTILQFACALPAAPYYLTYYNPWLGGPGQAAAQVPVGWGEGLEQAAQYLNSLPGAETLAVSSWYSDIFQPYFVGRQASFSDDGRAQLAADYVVFYVNQLQRQKPYPGLINYFRAKEPVFVVDIGPLGNLSPDGQARWVEVYRAPAAQSAGGAPKIEGVAQLLAYRVVGGRIAGGKAAEADAGMSPDAVRVTLFLRVLGPLPEKTTFKGALVPISKPQTLAANLAWFAWLPDSLKGEWVEGAVVEWAGVATLPADLPPGDYGLAVTLQTNDGSVIAEFAISEKDPPLIINAPK